MEIDHLILTLYGPNKKIIDDVRVIQAERREVADGFEWWLVDRAIYSICFYAEEDIIVEAATITQARSLGGDLPVVGYLPNVRDIVVKKGCTLTVEFSPDNHISKLYL
jgi:hypothetical protein